jgi:asparagine synthase (glutamine-hydrolysing)
VNTYLVDDIMTKVDRMSMAVSLEAREPLLDHRLLEFAAQVPSGLKLKNGRGKHLLRRVLERRLPKTLVDRPKQGFAAPIGQWLRGPLSPLVNDLLLDGRFRTRGIFDSSYVARLWREHRSNRQDHCHRLWSLMMLELWFRQFADQPAAPRAGERKGVAA